MTKFPYNETVMEHFRHPRNVGQIEHPDGKATEGSPDTLVQRFCEHFTRSDAINNFPLIVMADDSEFTARTLENFLWVTFTRSSPAPDVYGIEPFMVRKHWGCRGALVIDARVKPHHAPSLVEDPEVTKRVDKLGEPFGPLHGII